MRDAPSVSITLEEASNAASRGEWLSILGLPPSCSEHDVHRARREMQRYAHQDRGGCPELSTIINMAADNVLAILDPAASRPRGEQDRKDELQRSREETRQRREEELRRRREKERRILEEQRQAQCAHSLSEMVRVAHQRGGSKRAVAYLSMHAGRAFPAARRRVQALCKQKGGAARAHALVYAVEQEIAARRAAREEKWPKTSGLELRNPEKNAALVALKRQYKRAYQHLRHLRRTGQLHAHARLTAKRLLREAWMILLALPAWRCTKEEEEEEGTLALSNSPEFP